MAPPGAPIPLLAQRSRPEPLLPPRMPPGPFTSVPERKSAFARFQEASTPLLLWRSPSWIFRVSEPLCFAASNSGRGLDSRRQHDRQSPHTLSPTAGWVAGPGICRIPRDGESRTGASRRGCYRHGVRPRPPSDSVHDVRKTHQIV
ncbi:hypothetical protein NDU88_010311 [Pleurodeles waltl]|uniref:Uncharacterized protein n=1 Tax=Pleurodeles waltl TaxID=8319 RepID=A0AAV7QW07_PLEWA|nr:hypothetical protein NDU88_010311 [Pleurodeles waltl]